MSRVSVHESQAREFVAGDFRRTGQRQRPLAGGGSDAGASGCQCGTASWREFPGRAERRGRLPAPPAQQQYLQQTGVAACARLSGVGRRGPAARQGMSAALRNGLASALLAAALGLMPLFAPAQQDGTISGDKTTDMVVDAVVMRPLGLAATVVGTVLTVVALPFTIPSGSVETSARQLILRPADYTFKRPLGDFSASGEDGR